MDMLPNAPLTLETKYHVLVEISHKLRDTFDLDEILNQLLDTLRVITHYDAAGIFVVNREVDITYGSGRRPKTLIAAISQRGFDPNPIEQDSMLSCGGGVVGFVIKEGQSVVIPDVRIDSRYVIGRSDTLSEIAVPIMLNEHIIGALNLESDRLAAFNENDLELLRFFADAAAISIEKAVLHQKLIEKEHTDRQLKTAREVQLQLVPECPPLIPGYEISGICLSAFDIGGDYFDYIGLDDQKLGIAIADVSGHGISAALVMSAFRALLRTQARIQPDPVLAAKLINQILPEFIVKSDFVTAVHGVLDPANGQFTYANCGHPPPLLFRSNGEIEKLILGGPALGVFDHHEFESGQAKMRPGDLLLLHTDGVTEAFGPDGNSFGAERLSGFIRQNLTLPVHEIISAIVDAVKSFSGSDVFLDDFTLVLVRRKFH